ncbi:MAG: hypothetical protein ACJAYU_002393 [Bradymonadia bacterium]
MAAALLAAIGSFLAYQAREPDAQRVDLVLSSPAPGAVTVTHANGPFMVSGTLAGADACEVDWGGQPVIVAAGEFSFEVSAPATTGGHLVWVGVTCDGLRAARFTRRVVVEAASGVRPLAGTEQLETVARLTLATAPLLAPAQDFILGAANDAIARYLAEEVRGADLIRIAVPVGRIAASIEAWASQRLGENAGSRLAEIIPDDLGEATLQLAWGPETSVALSNVRLTPGQNSVRAHFDMSVVVALDVSAEQEGRAAQSWDPRPMSIDLAQLSARFDLSRWPLISVAEVDLIGDLCERPDGRFWRNRCNDILPRLTELIEEPVERALNERAQAWAAAFSAETTILNALDPAGELGGEQLAADSGFALILRELNEEQIAVDVQVSHEWLARPGGLAAVTPLTGDARLEFSTAVINRGLQAVFDRPLDEVGSYVTEHSARLVPAAGEAIDRLSEDLGGRGRLGSTDWTSMLAFTNLRVAPQVRIRPYIPAGDLALAIHGVPLFRGVDRDDVRLLVSAELPVTIGRVEGGYELRPDISGLMGRLALEAQGPESTTRDDARRFATFLQQEIARNFGDSTEEPLVDLSGIVDSFSLAPVVPDYLDFGQVKISVESLRFDAPSGSFIVEGSGLLTQGGHNEQ